MNGEMIIVFGIFAILIGLCFYGFVSSVNRSVQLRKIALLEQNVVTFIREFHSSYLDKVEEVNLPESFIKTAAATRKDRSLIVNQCVACYADLPSGYIPYISGGKFPPANGLVRVVLMNNRLLGGLGFPGGKGLSADPLHLSLQLAASHGSKTASVLFH